LPPTNSASKTT
jgi:hypothetical protein